MRKPYFFRKQLLGVALSISLLASVGARAAPPILPTTGAGAGVGGGRATVNCQERPGFVLCNLIKDALVYYGTSCTGDPCTQLWENEARLDNELRHQIEYNVAPSDNVDKDLATKAYQLADAICGTSRTSVDAAGYAAVDAENALLPHLADLQTAGKLDSVRTCSIVVN